MLPPLRRVSFLLCTALVLAATGMASSPRAWNAEGVELLKDGEDRRAVAAFRKAHEALPYNEVIRGNLAEAYFALGFRLLESRRFEEAAETFSLGRPHAAEEARFTLHRGYALFMAGDHLGAENEFHRAIDRDGADARAYRLLGRVHYAQGRLFQARQAWERALELVPGDEELLALLAKVSRELTVEEGMQQQYGGNFTISWHGGAVDDLGGKVLEVLQDAYREVGHDLGYYPDTMVPVLLYSDREFAELTASPDWAGGLYDGKIRIPFGCVKEITPSLKALLYHEYSHVAVRYLTNGNCPTWLDEGLAELAAGRHRMARGGPPGTEEEVWSLPPERLQGSFRELSAGEARTAYRQSLGMVGYLVDNYGWHAVGEILAALGRGGDLEEVVDAALAPYGSSYHRFLADWRDR